MSKITIFIFLLKLALADITGIEIVLTTSLAGPINDIAALKIDGSSKPDTHDDSFNNETNEILTRQRPPRPPDGKQAPSEAFGSPPGPLGPSPGALSPPPGQLRPPSGAMGPPLRGQSPIPGAKRPFTSGSPNRKPPVRGTIINNFAPNRPPPPRVTNNGLASVTFSMLCFAMIMTL